MPREQFTLQPPARFDEAAFRGLHRELNLRLHRIAELFDAAEAKPKFRGALNVGANRVTNIATAVANDDAVPLHQLQSEFARFREELQDELTSEGDPSDTEADTSQGGGSGGGGPDVFLALYEDGTEIEPFTTIINIVEPDATIVTGDGLGTATVTLSGYTLKAGRPTTTNDTTLTTTAAGTGTLYGGTSASAILRLMASSSGSAHTGTIQLNDAQNWWPDVPDPDAINSGFTVAKFTPAITDTTASSTKRLILFDPTFTVSATTSIAGTVGIFDVAGTWNHGGVFRDDDVLTIVNYRSTFANAGFAAPPGPRTRRLFWDHSVNTSTGTPTDGILIWRTLDITPTFTANGAGSTLYISTQGVGLRASPIFNALAGGLVSGSDAPEQASFNAVRLDAPSLNTSGGGVIDIGVYCGLTCSDYGGLTGISTPLSVRSLGALVEMRHAGPGVFGANAAPTNASVALEAQSTTRCFLNARMTTAQQVTMTGVAVADGMQLYDSTLTKMQFRENGAWVGFITTATGITITVQEDDVTVDAAVTTLDFIEPDATLVTSSPAGEANIAMNKYALLAGRSGGQTLIGGTAASNALVLQSTSDSTRGTVDVERMLRIHTATSVSITGTYNVTEVPLSLSMDSTNPTFRVLLASGTVTYTTNPAAAGMGAVFNLAASFVNSGNLTMAPLVPYAANPTLSPASASTTTAWAVRGLNMNPTLTAVAGGGTAAATDMYGVRVAGTYNGGWTVTDSAAVRQLDPAGTPAALTRLGFAEIDSLTKGTTNYSLWSKGASVVFAHGGAAVFGVSQTTLTVPAATMDISGTTAFRRVSDVSLSNGVNDNVNMDGRTFVRITGPTAAYSIAGITNGVDGRILILYNTVAFNMTIKDNAGTSTAANQIITMTGADVSTNAVGAAMLVYDSSQSRWICFHIQA